MQSCSQAVCDRRVYKVTPQGRRPCGSIKAQAKWEEMFGEKKEEEISEKEELKVKKPCKKAAPKKKVAEGDAIPELQVEKKPRGRKSTSADPTSEAPKRTRAKKPKTSDTE